MLRSGIICCALHKLFSREGCEALAYESVYATAMLRSGIICCVLHKLSSREGLRGTRLRVGICNCYATLGHHLLCIAQTVFTRGVARHSPTSRYMQLLCCARALFVVHCTNCLHELKLSVSYIIMDRAARGAVSARRIRLPRVAA